MPACRLDGLPGLSDAISSSVLPRFESLPHFLGLTAIKLDLGARCEIIVTSYWDDGLEESEQASKRFIEEIVRETGRNPSRKVYDILNAQVRDTAGEFRLGVGGWKGRPNGCIDGVKQKFVADAGPL